MSDFELRRGLDEIAKAIEKHAAAQIQAAQVEAEGRRIAAIIAKGDTDVIFARAVSDPRGEAFTRRMLEDDPKARGGRRFSSLEVHDRALTDEEVRARYCSEGAFDEPKPLFDEPTNEAECRRTCPGFSQCRDLGCERFGRDLHQGV